MADDEAGALLISSTHFSSPQDGATRKLSAGGKGRRQRCIYGERKDMSGKSWHGLALCNLPSALCCPWGKSRKCVKDHQQEEKEEKETSLRTTAMPMFRSGQLHVGR